MTLLIALPLVAALSPHTQLAVAARESLQEESEAGAAEEPALPLQELVKGFEAVDTLLLKYEVLSRDGTVGELRVSYSAPDQVHLLAQSDDRYIEAWSQAEGMTFLTRNAGRFERYEVDFDRVLTDPLQWHKSVVEAAFGSDNRSPLEPRSFVSLWPSADPSSTWEMGIHHGTESGSLFGWLDRLDGVAHDAVRLEDRWRVTLGGGQRLDLDPANGTVLHAMIDPSDPEQGEVRLLESAVNGELPAEEFEPSFPEDTAVGDANSMTEGQRLAMWRTVRGLIYAQAAKAFADDDSSMDRDALVEGLGEFHVACFEARTDLIRADLGGQVATAAEEILAWYDENASHPGAKNEASMNAERLRAALGAQCDRLGARLLETSAESVVEDPSPELEALLAAERDEGARRLSTSLSQPILKDLDDRFARIDG